MAPSQPTAEHAGGEPRIVLERVVATDDDDLGSTGSKCGEEGPYGGSILSHGVASLHRDSLHEGIGLSPRTKAFQTKQENLDPPAQPRRRAPRGSDRVELEALQLVEDVVEQIVVGVGLRRGR